MADTYKVRITRYAYKQMREIRRYIEEDLSAPEAAKTLLKAMRNAIGALQSLPIRHQLVDEEPWRSEGVRRLIVKNFNIYYWVDELNEKIHVTAVVYGKRNQLDQLAAMKKE